MRQRAQWMCEAPDATLRVSKDILNVTTAGGSIHHCRSAQTQGRPMPIKSKYLFIASMDVDADKEALFNEVYDTEHVPNLLKVPGVHSVARVEGEPFSIMLGGEEKKMEPSGAKHSAVYEIDGPHVLMSPEWAKAVEAGRWPGEVRPFTRNRKHALYKVR
jgi:hypothetical protein